MHASTSYENRSVGNRGGGNFVGVAFAAALATAGAMYLLDPVSGNRRRAVMRDKWQRLQRQSREFIDKASRDATHRAQGLYRGAANRVRRDTVDDETLEQRVRAELGHLTSHPRAIRVECFGGVVYLHGDILASDVDSVLRGVARVSGVTRVEDRLLRHQRADGISALQGRGRRRGLRRMEFLQSNWAPAPRMLAGATAAGMIMSAFARRSRMAYALAAGGAALMARAVSNVPMAELIGLGGEEPSELLIQKTIEVYAEPEEVYSQWRDLEQLPRFMSHIREIRRLDDTHYHWVVDGPAGMPVEWDSEITADVPNELIAWRTVEGSTVQNSGVVRFEPSSYGGTRMHIRLGYRPPARSLGHTIAKAFGRDPQRQIDDDIVRFKSYVETHRVPRDSAFRQQSRGAGFRH